MSGLLMLIRCHMHTFLSSICWPACVQMRRVFRWRRMWSHSVRRYTWPWRSTADDSTETIPAASRSCFCVFRHYVALDLSARAICSWANCAKLRDRPRRRTSVFCWKASTHHSFVYMYCADFPTLLCILFVGPVIILREVFTWCCSTYNKHLQSCFQVSCAHTHTPFLFNRPIFP